MKRNKYKGIYVFKGYGHFDNKKSPEDFVWYVENSENIVHHSFMPFILDTRRYKKYDKNKPEKRVTKERPICFCSHLDRYIYQRYNYLLNEEYNKYAEKYGIDECAVAYRSNPEKPGVTNIEIARDVFLKIEEFGNCHIIVGDFKSFFDKLDHKFLKEMLCVVLNVDSNKLPMDYYKVYRSMTKYAYFDMKDIAGMQKLKKKEIYKSDRVFSIEEFRKAKGSCLRINKNTYGIPQGSPISSVFSNIYMIKADMLINEKIKEYGGIYRRYSDDILIVIPNVQTGELKEIYEDILNILKLNGNPELENSKTKIFKYDDDTIKNITNDFFSTACRSKDIIEYLGFAFDGKKVTIRDKSYSKFLYRMHKKIDTINRRRKMNLISDRPKVNVGTTNLYELYSPKGNSNFLSYIDRVEKAYEGTGLFDFHRDRVYKKIKHKLKY